MGKPQKGKSAPTQGQPQEMVVLTTRVTAEERDQIRAAAGWGGLQRFVREAVMAAVQRAKKASR